MQECIHNTYLNYLLNKMTPGLFKEFQGVYTQALKQDKQYIEKAQKTNKKYESNVIMIFQYFLNQIEKLNNEKIEKIYKNIKNESGKPELFDNIVKATLKSTIILLSNEKLTNFDEKYYDIDIKTFIHKCCIECGQLIYNHPRLFWHDFSEQEIKDNQNKIIQVLKSGIKTVILDVIPMNLILDEYLKSEEKQQQHTDLIVNNEQVIKKEHETDLNSLIPTNITKLDDKVNCYFE